MKTKREQRKRMQVILIAVVMLLSTFVVPVTVYGQGERPPGQGTSEEPFMVSTPEHFRWMGSNAGSGNAGAGRRRHYILMNDITIDFTLGGFYGTLDGRGHTVYFTVSEAATGSFSGLTRYMVGTIGNLRVQGSFANATARSSIGGLTGRNSGTILNSSASVNIDALPNSGRVQQVGGLVGMNYGTIINSYATGNISGTTRVGGLVGQNRGYIINSFATGDVRGDSYIGALVGFNNTHSGHRGTDEAIIRQGYAIGNVEWTGGRDRRGPTGIGGVVGDNSGIIEGGPPIMFWLGPQIATHRGVVMTFEQAENQRIAREMLTEYLISQTYTALARAESQLSDTERELINRIRARQSAQLTHETQGTQPVHIASLASIGPIAFGSSHVELEPIFVDWDYFNAIEPNTNDRRFGFGEILRRLIIEELDLPFDFLNEWLADLISDGVSEIETGADQFDNNVFTQNFFNF